MASNLFGQYYSTKVSTQKYQTYNYTCSNSDDGTNNSVIFDDSAIELVDSNGNTISSLDLSSIQANPITDYRSGSFTLNPGEVRFIEGLEYGKSYKKVFLQVPDEIIQNFAEHWEQHCNVDFNIIYNYNLDLKEFNIKTSFGTDEETSVVYRIKNLLDVLGLDEKIDVELEDAISSDGQSHTYFVFTSLVLGYDFIIEDFKIHTIKYAYYIDEQTEDRVEVYLGFEDVDMPLYGLSYSAAPVLGNSYTINFTHFITKDNTDSEDNVVFPDGTVYQASTNNFNLGHYDRMDYPNDEDSAMHFYYGDGDENFVIEDTSDGSVDSSSPQGNDGSTGEINDASGDVSTGDDSSVDSSVIEDGSTTIPDSSNIDSSVDDEFEDEELKTDDGETIYVIPEKLYQVKADRYMENPAYKYANGASRVWFFVPEYPIGDEQNLSLKINHVKDFVVDFVPEVVPVDASFGRVVYNMHFVDIVATEKNEKERHGIEEFRFQEPEIRYKDVSNGQIETIIHQHIHNDVHKLHTHKMGMYRYLEYVQTHNEWLNFGQFYGLITNSDDPETCIRNMANSVFILNENEYAIKVNYFVGV